MADLECQRCGHHNAPDANFCSSCGAPLEADVQDRPTIQLQLESPAGSPDEVSIDLDELPGDGVLVVRAGPNAGSTFAIDKDTVTAGRHPDSDIFLDDVTVSRRHAEVVRAGGGRLVVRDVGSLNGTYLNRERIEEGELADGDVVQVGKFKLVFVAGAEANG
ncbi:MAG TPA: FHA domain-containing protein [Acidimicrobiales bacterium]|nr:FHA domain-containing protein [Acidimicrobiales bacterium]